MAQWIRLLAARCLAVLRKEHHESEFDEELATHVDLLTEDNVKGGMTREQARRQALHSIGGLMPTRELHRETRGMPAWENLVRDVRYALRTLRREPGFFAVAVVIIGLGIGATTAVFSVVNAVLLRPLPFHEPERLVRVANTGTGGLSSVTSRTSNLRDWRQMSQSFDDLAGYFAFFDYSSYTLTGAGEPERLVGVGVTETFLPLLGVSPALGRNFVEEECVWNGRPAALLTHSLWESRFGSDPEIVGRSLTLNDQATTVVGVLPPSFDFATFFSPGSRIDLIVPFPVADETDRWGNTLAVIGRLKPGATIQGAQAELDVINQQLAAAEPDRWGLGAAVSGLREHISGNFREAFWLLAGAVGLVLLITCTNLSNLLLARAASRRKEIAVRSAMGAGRLRLIRQMLTESLVLSGSGAILGVVIAYVTTTTVVATQAVSIPLLHSASIDGTALGFASLMALATGVLFGMAPALQVSGSNEYTALRDSSRGSSEGKGRVWLRNALVASEVALACVLLIGAGLLLRSFVTVLDVDLGFRPQQAVSWRVETSQRFDSLPEKYGFYERLARQVESLPGVESVGLTDVLPLGRNRTWGVGAKGVTYRPGEYPIAYPRLVSPAYIKTMGIPLIAGRTFTAQDNRESERVLLINEAMARRLWPDQDPIGQILLNNGEWRVAGVVADVRHTSLEEGAGLEMYMPMAQHGDWQAVELVVRSRLPAESLVPSVQSALREFDEAIPTGDYQTLGQIVDRAVSPRRFMLSLISAFALVAVLLASLGIYGVISYSVSQRTQEIGIRMALGASASKVRRQVITKTLALSGAGMLLGIAASYALARLMQSLLYGVTPDDPPTFAATAALLLVIAATAGYLPARRASRIHPTTALRAG